MRWRWLISLLIAAQSLLALFGSPLAVAQSPAINQAEVERIVGASIGRSGAMEFLEVLSDRIGGRVTGSPESARPASLILKALSDGGLANAHTEQYPIQSGWKRGEATARVISPVSQIFLSAHTAGLRGQMDLCRLTDRGEHIPRWTPRRARPRPIPSPVKDLRPARATCEHCHWPERFTGDKFIVKTSYTQDEKNTAQITALLVKVGGHTWQGSVGIFHEKTPVILPIKLELF